MTCPTRQQPGIGLNVHVRTFKYCRQVGHVQVCPCAERTRKARNHLQPECFGCIRTHTHRYNFVIVAVAIQQAYRVHRLSFVLCADCHLTLVCLRSCSFMFFVVMLLLLMLPLFCFLFAHRHATRQRKAKALLRQHIATLQKV